MYLVEIYPCYVKVMSTKDTKMGNEILFGDECYAIQGAVFEVYREMGEARCIRNASKLNT